MATSTSDKSMQDVLSTTLQELASTSLKSIRPMMNVMMSGMSAMAKSADRGDIGNLKIPFLDSGSSDCCAPKQECPPHCIAAIHRCAVAGERIIVPFLVKNSCGQTKTWRVGVRELVDVDGNPAPAQPVLNKQTVTIEPGRSERILMAIDLAKFRTVEGKYSTEIVLREKNINQNICFTLDVGEGCEVVTASPADEQKLSMRWQSWQSHFYCEPPRKAVSVAQGPVAPPATPLQPAPAKDIPK